MSPVRSISTTARQVARPAARALTRPVGTVRAVRTARPDIVLTYDDGPDPEGTPAVLDALARSGATATFFVLTRRARLHTGLLAEVAAAGHEIALHGIDHTRLTRLPLAEVRRRIRAGKAELEDLTGTPVRWFRAPYGALLPRHWLEVRRAGMMPVAWGPTPRDWDDDSEERLAEGVMASSGAGEIVLAHDGYAGAEDNAFDGPAPAIDRGKLASLMLEGFAQRGLTGRSLGAALEHGTVAKWAWFLR